MQDVKDMFMETRRAAVPKRQERHYSYNENLNEPWDLIADEPTDVEEETPADDNEPIEELGPNDPITSPAFEE
jgi:hypothetical protein